MRPSDSNPSTFSGQSRINAFAGMILLYTVLLFGSWGDGLDMMSYDFASSQTAPVLDAKRPVLVEIDDDSLDYLGQWPWPRRLLAALIERIDNAEAQAIGLDILINEPTDIIDDQAFIDVARRSGRLVMPVAAHPRAVNRVVGEWQPLIELVDLAHADAMIDTDGVVRSAEPLKTLGTQPWPSMAFSLTGVQPNAQQLLLPFPQPEPFDRISAVDALIGTNLEELLEGRLVVIGVTAAGIARSFMTPLQRPIAGVELQAYQIAAALNDSWWRLAPWPARLAVWIPFFAASAWLMRGGVIGLAAIPLLAILSLAISRYVLHLQGWWLSPVPAAISMSAFGIFWRTLEWHQSRAIATLERARASATLASVADAVIATDDQGRIVIVNDAAERLLECHRTSLLGHHTEEIPVLAVLKQDHAEPVSIRTMRGSRRDVLVSTGRIEGETGGMAYVLHDVTRREEANRALAQSERDRLTAERRLQAARRMSAMAEVSAAIAHELNQPLAALTTYAATARRTLQNAAANAAIELPQQLPTLIDKIDAQASRSAKVVKQLRGVFEQARHPTQRLDLNATVKECQILAESELGLAREHLQLDLSDDLPDVAHDPIQLQQLLLNLIRNSMDAHPDVDQLSIRITTRQAPHSRVVLSTTDNGPGIPADQIEAIFEPLASTKPHGLGIGLAVCRSIAEAHGGTLSVQSPHSKGAQFVLSLPHKS